MRHHRRPQDADRDVEHAGIGHDLRCRDESFCDAQKIRPRSDQFLGEASADHHDQGDDQRLDVAEAFVLQKQNDENIERRDADAVDQRNAEEQIEGDRRADDFRQIASGDGQLADAPRGQNETGRL